VGVARGLTGQHARRTPVQRHAGHRQACRRAHRHSGAPATRDGTCLLWRYRAVRGVSSSPAGYTPVRV